MTLSDVKCRNARPRSKLQKLSDGGGLQLWVQRSGARLWRLAYRFDGKQKLLALGSYSKATAREVDLTVRELIAESYRTAKSVLESRRKDLDTGAALLPEKETITPDDFPPLGAKTDGVALKARPGTSARCWTRRWTKLSPPAILSQCWSRERETDPVFLPVLKRFVTA